MDIDRSDFLKQMIMCMFYNHQ